MSDMSLNHEFHRFRDHRADLASPSTRTGERNATLTSGGVLAVGLLMGGGFAGAAACVSVLLENQFPHERWPWSSPAADA